MTAGLDVFRHISDDVQIEQHPLDEDEMKYNEALVDAKDGFEKSALRTDERVIGAFGVQSSRVIILSQN